MKKLRSVFCRCVDLSTSVAIALKILKTVLGNCEKFRVGDQDRRASLGSRLLSHGGVATHYICNLLISVCHWSAAERSSSVMSKWQLPA